MPIRKYFKNRIGYWNVIAEHPNYDSFWQARNLLPHLRNVAPAVMTVGGWFDAEDLYGALNTYRAVEKQNPKMLQHAGHGTLVARRLGGRRKEPSAN